MALPARFTPTYVSWDVSTLNVFARKAAAVGAVAMGLLLVQPQAGSSILGWVGAVILSAAAIPAYIGKTWGVALLRMLYWLLLIGWTLMAIAYYVVGPLNGSAVAPGPFFTVVILWSAGGVAGLSTRAPRVDTK